MGKSAESRLRFTGLPALGAMASEGGGDSSDGSVEGDVGDRVPERLISVRPVKGSRPALWHLTFTDGTDAWVHPEKVPEGGTLFQRYTEALDHADALELGKLQARFERRRVDRRAAATKEPTAIASQLPPARAPRLKGVCRTCAGHMFAGLGFFRPEQSLITYLMYYHTLLWVVCRAPGEEHIPIVHRLSFVLLSMVFNLLVVVLFTATDVSLISSHCPDKHACSDFEIATWNAAEVLLVALIDTAFWPILKAGQLAWLGKSRVGSPG